MDHMDPAFFFFLCVRCRDIPVSWMASLIKKCSSLAVSIDMVVAPSEFYASSGKSHVDENWE